MVVFGGSLGAHSINQAVAGLVEGWRDRDDRAIYHIVGRRDWVAAGAANGTARPSKGTGGRRLHLVRVPYEERMADVYAAADVAVCRAGAMTVAELAVAGVPAVLVPLPGAPGDHQTENARVLERAGAAVVLADAACTAAGLADTLDRLLARPAVLEQMSRAASAAGRPDAAAAGARLVEEAARCAPGARAE